MKSALAPRVGMQDRRVLALLALVLGIVGGVLFLVEALRFGQNPTIDLDFIVDRLLLFTVAILVIFGGFVVWRGNALGGGLLNIILGVIGLVLGLSLAASLLALLSGILGLVAGPSRRR